MTWFFCVLPCWLVWSKFPGRISDFRVTFHCTSFQTGAQICRVPSFLEHSVRVEMLHCRMWKFPEKSLDFEKILTNPNPVPQFSLRVDYKRKVLLSPAHLKVASKQAEETMHFPACGADVTHQQSIHSAPRSSTTVLQGSVNLTRCGLIFSPCSALVCCCPIVASSSVSCGKRQLPAISCFSASLVSK